ncbi:hypothetical protein DFH08DRAFT_964831 [Mycena albidolilacea]|uniref:Uncharacterized protein n=1 Tax=Mycena albidolilacea TaxID=1033008 RepID=A0AAD7EMV9_9AGAR|nr:hypothetical protein DFH08DRAFT_964831 [Mycena albidolilacea]
MHAHPNPYYDLWNFSLGVWVAVPLAYEFTVVMDEPTLIRRSGTFAAIAPLTILSRELCLPPLCLPTTNTSRQHLHLRSDDETEASAMCKFIKLEPHTPPAYCCLPPPACRLPSLCLAGGSIKFAPASPLLSGGVKLAPASLVALLRLAFRVLLAVPISSLPHLLHA